MVQKSIAIVALMLLIVAACVQAAGPGRHAVIVGINDYADAAIPDLKYAESDAKAVYDTLIDAKIGRFPKDNVTLLLGKDVSPGKIKAALYKLRGVGKDDLVIIFYSGHGAKEGDEAFWVTQDADRKALPATSLTNSEIRKYLQRIPSQRMVVLLDCCYAASTVKKSLADPKKLFGEFEGKGRVTIAGSADNQEALEYEDKKAGVFTHYLVGGLRGAADVNTDGVVTFEEMWRYLGDNVRKASIKQGGLHEPVLISEGGFTPQFLLTFNPKVQAASLKSVQILRKLFAEDKITADQFDLGRKALSAPALDAVAKARREVFASLVAGKLEPKFLASLLQDAEKKVRVTAKPPVSPSGTKPTLAIAPFTVLGEVKVKDAGRILAERLLPQFSGKYEVIDQGQLARFLAQDNLSMSDLVDLVGKPGTKGLAKAVRLRRVSYLVVGSLSGSPDGSLSITARICDWQSGTARANRYAQIGGENWKELLDRLPLLSGRLTGVIGGIGPGPEVVLPRLPEGVDALRARIMQLQGVLAQFTKARDTMTDTNPRVKYLGDKLIELHAPIAKATDAKLSELAATDAKLANMYKPNHPQRKALLDEVAYLKLSQSGVFSQITSQIEAWGLSQAFLKLMSQAKATLAKMPSSSKKLSGAQKAELRQAQDVVAAALVYKPSDHEALALQKRIETALMSKSDGSHGQIEGQSTEANKLSELVAGHKRTAMLKWLIDHPKSEELGNVVELWAAETPDCKDEDLFRQTVAKLGSGKEWQDVLLDSLNAKSFAARGSALSVLAARGAEIDLLDRIKRMTAKTVSLQSMQTFAEKFGYVPANGGELLACIILHHPSGSKGSLDAPARLAKQWNAKYKYKFNIRDFHLLSHMATDQLRSKLGRDELIKQIVAKLGSRKHVAGGGGLFSKQVANMTLPDLWNIVLLDEMLLRQRVALAMRILADRLRAGLKSPRSGLVFCEGGKASAKLYPQTIDSTRGDRDHIPERQLQRAGFSALCHFHTRFETVYNGDRASASKHEVSASTQGNFYGLVLTSIDSRTFSAFYYNPDGAVVSLGVFVFPK